MLTAAFLTLLLTVEVIASGSCVAYTIMAVTGKG